jgi:hypothetical protein
MWFKHKYLPPPLLPERMGMLIGRKGKGVLSGRKRGGVSSPSCLTLFLEYSSPAHSRPYKDSLYQTIIT